MRYFKENPWQVVTIILGLLLIASIFTNGFNSLNLSDKDKVANKAINFIKSDAIKGKVKAKVSVRFSKEVIS